jgi:hypothetical protein
LSNNPPSPWPTPSVWELALLLSSAIAAQLSKSAAILYGTIHDAPEDVKRVHARLRDLEFVWDAIDHIRKRYPSDDVQLSAFWNEKFGKLRCDFSEFKQFTNTLNAGVKGRIRWLLSHQDRVKKILALLSEDIEVLKTLH